jgi:xanthine/uracil/vitamin C permease (AzgA family)
MFKDSSRYAALLALSIWTGALVFFNVVAYVAFTVLPNTHEAGLVVGASLRHLHVLGMVCGFVLLIALIMTGARGRPRAWLVSVFLTGVMLGLTGGSQLIVLPAMERHRAAVGEIMSVPPNNPDRAAFERLHVFSTWLEESVLFFGLVVVGCVALEPRSQPDLRS